MRFFTNQIKPAYLLILFTMHVVAGCIHTWLAYRFYPNHGDIWYFFEESVIMKQELIRNPSKFLYHVFSGGQFNITDTSKPLLDVQYQMLQYVNIFLNLFSFNNFYINTLLFTFPVFAGTMALFKVFYTFFNNPLPAFCALLLPSVLFWTSVVYKDSLFYLATGYFFYYLMQPGKPTVVKMMLLLLFTGLMFTSRANALITLLPAAAFLFLTEKKILGKAVSIIVIITVISVTVIAFNAFMPVGLLHGISERQKDFQSLAGGSRIYLPVLEPTVSSLLAVFPAALLNGFFQPLPGTGGKSIYTAFSIEPIVIWGIILLVSWLLAKKKAVRFSNFDYCCLLFALPGLVIIGYMVPFAGAIIRYRSIYLPFLLAPFINIICNYPVNTAKKMNDFLLQYVMINKGKTA